MVPPRTAVVEEFDDDTEIPLPSRPLLTNPHGPLLQEINDDDDDDISSDDDSDEPAPGPASQFRPPSTVKPPVNTVTDITPYKKYVSHPPPPTRDRSSPE